MESRNYIFGLLVGSDDNTVRKLDADGQVEWTFPGHSAPVRDVAVGPDDSVYTASYDGTVRKLNPDGEEIWTFTGHQLGLNVRDVAVDPGLYATCDANCQPVVD